MFIITILIVLFQFNKVFADNIQLPDSHAPISVMGDHTHKKKEVMFSYRFMNMQMGKLFNNNKKLSKDTVMSAPNGASDGSGSYMNAPKSMSMDMHMFGMMYAPSNRITLMLMNSFLKKEMTQQRMRMAGGANFDVNSSGFGDFKASALITLLNETNWENSFLLGVSLPTGSIDKRGRTPASSNTRLGYGMQNGTGTYDTYFLINNLNTIDKFKIGEQIYFKVPASENNSKGYKYGKEFDANLWMSYRILNELSGSVKFTYNYKDKMSGSDNEMNKRMSPAMDSYNQGFQKFTLGIGLNFINHENFLKNNRLGLEFLVPIHQKYNGIQMGERYKIVLGWQYAF